jgi:hypothetical protein
MSNRQGHIAAPHLAATAKGKAAILKSGKFCTMAKRPT